MGVSEQDRRAFRRIAEAKAAARSAAETAHRESSLEERLRKSWKLYLQTRTWAKRVRDEDPSPFYERARARGLYR